VKPLIKFLLICATVGVGYFVASIGCSASDFACPQNIVVRQELVSPQADWKVLQDDLPHQLKAVDIYDGDPKELVALVPDSLSEREGRLVYRWMLPRQEDRPYWIACSYSDTSIKLAKALGPEITVCEVTCNPQITIDGRPLIERIALN
jgi:hypothetical protein